MGVSSVSRILLGACIVVVSSGLQAQEVIPDFHKEPGLSPNKSFVNQRFGEYIDPANGALQLHYTDLFLPGNGGFDIKVTRSYNSASVNYLNPAEGYFDAGLGWTVHFGRVLRTNNNSPCANTNAQSVLDNPVLELPDGGRQLLAATGSASPLFMTQQRWRVDCTAAGYSVYSPDGVRYDMTQMVNVGTGVTPIYAWYTTKITDRNGNVANISYAAAASPELKQLTTNDSRLITFTYLNPGTLNRRISTIEAAGKTYTYGYDPIPNTSGRYYLSYVTRPDGNSWQYAYNGSTDANPGGYMINTVTYPQGGTISYQYNFIDRYDDQGMPRSQLTAVSRKTQSTGGVWTFVYTPGNAGQLDTTVVKGPDGDTTYKHVGPNYVSSGNVWMVGLLMSKTVGSQLTESYTWGKQKISSENYVRPGEFVIKVDTGETNAPILTKRVLTLNGAAHTTTYSSFDAYGNPGSVVEAGPNGGNRTTSIGYYINTSKWIVNQVQNESYTGSSVTRTFDANGNLSEINDNGVVTKFTYHPEGDIYTKVFPRNLTHTYTNYFRGIPKNESQPEGVSIVRTVSDAGNVLSERNGDLLTTSYAYDGLDRLTSITPPVGNKTTLSYARTSRTVTRGALSEVTAYNGFGDTTRVTLGGIATDYTVDAFGRRTFQSNPGAATVGTKFQYDILGRVTLVTNADTTTQGITYGAGTRAVRDERNKTTTYGYRAYGDPARQFLMSVTAPLATSNITVARNSKDLVTSVAQGGVTRSYGYNGNYYLTSVTEPETGTTTYGRDAAGNMTSRKVGASGTTTYVYDNLNRLTQANYPTGTPSATYAYNKRGLTTSASSSVGTRSYVYDNNGNLTSESLAIGGHTLTAGYGYNGNDQLTSITYPRSNNVVTYTVDALGRPTAISNYVSSVTYWPSGQVRRITYANGTYSDYDQNNRLWPSKLTVAKTGASTYINSSFGYDGVGNLTSITDTVDANYARTNVYDDINRLTSVTGSWGTNSWVYDGVGNITKEQYADASATKTYTYVNNKIDQFTWGNWNLTVSYDVYGNIQGSLLSSSMTPTAKFDDVPNLRCVSCNGTATQGIEYTYDAKNFRSSVRRGAITSYEMHGSNGNLLTEFTPDESNKLIEYIYLGGRRVAQRVTP